MPLPVRFPHQRLDAFHLVEGVVHDLAIGRVHRLERALLAVGQGLLGHLHGELAEGVGPHLPVTTDIDLDPNAARSGPLGRDPGQFLDRLEGAALGADQQAVLPVDHTDDAVVAIGVDPDPAVDPEGLDQAAQERLDMR